MGMFGKLAFWRKEPELPDLGDFAKDSGFGGPGGFGDAGIGKPGQEPGKGGFDQLGLGKEQEFGVEPGMPDIEPGYGGGPGLTPQQQGAPLQRTHARQPQQQAWPQQQQYAAPMTPMQPSQMEYTMSKDLEIVSSKLDALKATLDGVNQRLANLERLIQDNKKRW